MNLPEAFKTRIQADFSRKNMTETEMQAFFASFSEEPLKGLRFNRLKAVSQEDTKHLAELGIDAVRPVPWCQDGYYLPQISLGRDPYYHAGVFYQQEPSAMLPAEILGTCPGERILDLCAAPGGKATRIGADLKGEGLLVANEISADRARALLRNLELAGVRNAVITNSSPEELEKNFPEFFDRILIDAPCSGEGMFRRDKLAVRSWERYGPAACVPIQQSILTAAHRMLRPGGHLVYSTCTFSAEENEEMIDWFLANFSEYKVILPEIKDGLTLTDGLRFKGGIRIWPQSNLGDGHFCIHLQKEKKIEKESVSCSFSTKNSPNRQERKRALETIMPFLENLLLPASFPQWLKEKEQLFFTSGKAYWLPWPLEAFSQLQLVKMGAFLGEVKSTASKVVFTPSQGLALLLKREQIRPERYISLAREDQRLVRYLKGETIPLTEEEQTLLEKQLPLVIMVEGFPLGFGRQQNGSIKNDYPKAWRLQ